SKYINVNINNDELFNFANNTFISTAGTETSPISYSHECTYTTITNGLKHTSMTITDTSLPSQITSLAPVSGAISAKVDDTEIDWSKAEVTVKSYDSDIIDATWDANNKEVVFTPRFATGEATIFITVYDPDSGANGTISKTIPVNISNSTVTYIDDNKELQTVEIDPNINPNEVFASHDLKGPSAEYPYKIPLIDGESKLTISDPNKFIELALTNISDEVDTISATNFLAGCTKLEKLSLNGLGNVKTITGDHFLTGCTSLKELDLSNLTSLEENGIQSQHFLYCLNNLKEVNFGDLKANIFDEASLGDTAYTLSVINSATVAITDGVYLKGSDQEELMKLLYNKTDGTGWFRYLRDSAPW
ncbi:MAG: hypothetical protein HUJ52_04370, partial [Malacoplasma sp.]|nr:hypothetical protein [Malacoplasma sp.]